MHKIVLCNPFFFNLEKHIVNSFILMNEPWWLSLCSPWDSTAGACVTFLLCHSLSPLAPRHWYSICGHRVLFEHLLHHHPGLGTLLPVQLLHLWTSLDNLYQYLEHRCPCLLPRDGISPTKPGGRWQVMARCDEGHGRTFWLTSCGTLGPSQEGLV